MHYYGSMFTGRGTYQQASHDRLASKCVGDSERAGKFFLLENERLSDEQKEKLREYINQYFDKSTEDLECPAFFNTAVGMFLGSCQVVSGRYYNMYEPPECFDSNLEFLSKHLELSPEHIQFFSYFKNSEFRDPEKFAYYSSADFPVSDAVTLLGYFGKTIEDIISWSPSKITSEQQSLFEEAMRRHGTLSPCSSR